VVVKNGDFQWQDLIMESMCPQLNQMTNKYEENFYKLFFLLVFFFLLSSSSSVIVNSQNNKTSSCPLHLQTSVFKHRSNVGFHMIILSLLVQAWWFITYLDAWWKDHQPWRVCWFQSSYTESFALEELQIQKDSCTFCQLKTGNGCCRILWFTCVWIISYILCWLLSCVTILLVTHSAPQFSLLGQ
jgi:hypothetical protein